MIIISLLYHGTIDKYASNIVCFGVDLSKSKHYLDFGPGFYTTPNKDFAIATAKNHARKYNAFNKEDPVTPQVLVFKCDDNLVSTLNTRSFDEADEEWAHFVIANRCENLQIHQEYENNVNQTYDIVSGPTADGKGTITPIVEQINSGTMTMEEVNYSDIAPASSNDWGEQVCFHTQEALSCIELYKILR